MSSQKQQNHSTSTHALIKAIKFDFIVYLVMQVCLEYFLDTVAPLSAKIYPLTDFVTFVSFLSNIMMFTSVYPSSLFGYLVYHNPLFRMYFKYLSPNYFLPVVFF